MQKNVYKVEFFFDGTEDDAHGLRRNLAQSIADDFKILRVYGVAVNMEESRSEEK